MSALFGPRRACCLRSVPGAYQWLGAGLYLDDVAAFDDPERVFDACAEYISLPSLARRVWPNERSRSTSAHRVILCRRRRTLRTSRSRRASPSSCWRLPGRARRARCPLMLQRPIGPPATCARKQLSVGRSALHFDQHLSERGVPAGDFLSGRDPGRANVDSIYIQGDSLGS